PWRAWAVLDMVGRENALTLLRQAVRKCAKEAQEARAQAAKTGRSGGAPVPLATLLERYHLLDGARGTRRAEDGWVERLSETILGSRAEQAAEAAAGALAEGFAPQQVGEALSLAANQLVLRQVE